MNKPHRKQAPRPFKAPYTARIMLAIDGFAVELKRFHRQIFPADWRSWAGDREDRCWVEYPMKDKHCITPRLGVGP